SIRGQSNWPCVRTSCPMESCRGRRGQTESKVLSAQKAKSLKVGLTPAWWRWLRRARRDGCWCSDRESMPTSLRCTNERLKRRSSDCYGGKHRSAQMKSLTEKTPRTADSHSRAQSFVAVWVHSPIDGCLDLIRHRVSGSAAWRGGSHV